MARLRLWFWVLGHDLRPKYLLLRISATLRAYVPILMTSIVYGILSVIKILTIPLMPFRIVIVNTYYVIFRAKELELLRCSMETHGGQKPVQ